MAQTDDDLKPTTLKIEPPLNEQKQQEYRRGYNDAIQDVTKALGRLGAAGRLGLRRSV